MPTTLILFNKPFGVLSQFRQDDNNDFATLSDFFNTPQDKNLRVAGRLDATSEGLLLLTDNGKLNQILTTPSRPNNRLKQGKTYWVQLDGTASDEQIHALATGVVLKDGKTLPAIVKRLDETDVASLWQAPDSIAKRKITSWLSITIFEGKNRQVRRMTAHVGLPCLRLIRVAHGDFSVKNLGVGECVRLILNDKDLQKFGVLPNQPKNAKKPSNSHKNLAKLLNKQSKLSKKTSTRKQP